MAKKNYSAEALIEQDYQQQLERRPEPQTQTQVDAPTISNTNIEAPKAPAIGGGLRGSQFVQSASIENPPKPKPFMALYQTTDGRPIYGSGIKGWVRKLWADVADPAKLLADSKLLSEERADEIWGQYNERVEESGKIIESKLKWSQWGEKIFGITSEEVASLTAGGRYEREIAEETGESQAGVAISRTWSIIRDTTQNFIWGGLDILGMDDTIIRKVNSTIMGVDSVADRFNKDEPENFVQKIWQLSGASVVKDLYTIHQNVKAGNTTWSEVGEVTKKYREGSAMAYTMIFDEAMRAEFDKGLDEGRDPILLAQEYGNWKTELAGSIIGSPSTYFGLNIKAPVNFFTKTGREAMPYATFLGRNLPFKVPWKTVVRIPSFGEVLNISSGARAIYDDVARYTTQSDKLKGLDDILKGAENVQDEVRAGEILRNASKHYADKFAEYTSFSNVKVENLLRADSIKNMWGLASYDSAGKISVASRDTNMFISSLLSNRGADTTLQVLRDLVIVAKGAGNDDAIKASSRLLSMNNANLVTSDVAMMVGQTLSKLDPQNIFRTIEKFKGNPLGLSEALTPQIQGAISDLIPSVDEMFDAKRALQKEFGVDFSSIKPKELQNILNDLKPADLNRVTKLNALSKQWDELPNIVKMANRATRIPELVAKKTTSAMNTLFQHLMPRSWARNVAGQTWSAAVALDLKSAVELGFQSLAAWSRGATKKVIQSGEEVLLKRIGYLIPTSARKFTQNVDYVEKGINRFGMMPVLQRTDDLFESGILVKATSEELLKGLPVAQQAPEYQNFIQALPTEQQAAFNVALERSFGNFDDAMGLFRQWTGSGEIEAWRLTRPSELMRKELDRLGLMDAFYDIQNNARNADEFQGFIDDFIDNYKQIVRKEAEKIPHATNTPDELADWGEDFVKLGKPEQQEMIADLMTSWNNTFESLNKASFNFMDSAVEMAKSQGRMDIVDGIKAVRNDVISYLGVRPNTYNQMNLVKSQVMDLYRKIDGMSINELLHALSTFEVRQGNKKLFSFQDIYPNIDATSLDTRKMKQLVIEAMYEQTSLIYKNSNIGAYESIMNRLEGVANALDSTVEEIAMQGGKENPFIELVQMRNTAMKIEEAYDWQRFFRALNFKSETDPAKKLSEVVDEFKRTHTDWNGNPAYMVETANRYIGLPAHGNNVASLANRFGIASQGTKQVTNVAGQVEEVLSAKRDIKLLNIINDFVGAKTYDNLNDVPLDIAEQAFRKHTSITESITALPNKVDKTKPYYTKDGTLVTPVNFADMTIEDAINYFRKDKRVPPYNKDFVTEPRSAWEGLQNFTDDIKMWGDRVVQDWGKTVKTLPSQVEDLVDTARKGFNERMEVVRLKASIIAESKRNWILHDYQKTYLDHALTYMLGNSFHYWTTRTYKKAFETLLQDPKYANVYLSYKEYLMKEHSDTPEWYRQNLRIDSLFGIELDNPYFVNLESMINPMYGLTGTDFNDPKKRVDWLSTTIDDMNKFGPTFSPLVSWAVAVHLYNKGEEDAAARWTGRLLPQSQIIKSGSAWLLSKLGIEKSIEIDPFVNFMDGGVDPYEKNRVSVALAMMVRDGLITQEEMIEASRIKDSQPESGVPDEAWLRANEIWEQAVHFSAEKRFDGDFSSFFFGTGMRPRTQEDMVVEKFWGDYGALLSSRDMMTAEQYRQEWDKLRENPEYGMFVDALLLSRKAGDEQDSAYAYNVLGRIPPGQMREVAEAVGINPDMLQAFYDSKGDFDEMGLTPQDQSRFMAGLVDIGAILAMPDNPTRAEWTQARSEYNSMNEEMERVFGDGIVDAINEFYESSNKADFLDDFPEVQQALDWQTSYVNQNPLLSRYYGGIDSIQQYYRSRNENILTKEFGEEMTEMYEEYSNPQIDPNRKKELSRVLKLYLKRRSQLRDESLRAISDIALLLPDPPSPQARSNVDPQGQAQSQLFQLTQPMRTPQEWEQVVGQPIMSIIQDYIYNGEEIPYVVSNNLDYIAEQQGFGNGDDLLMQIIQSLPQGVSQ